jgi:cytochrome c oxidase subunit 1
MSATSTTHDSSKNYINHESGIMSWLTTLDHKRIGLLYMIAVLLFFFIGGVFAMLIRWELFSAGKNIVDAGTYNQFMTFHGAIMTFMVIIPGVPAFLGNFVLPLQLGAKDVAFPRVNLLSWYCLVIGAAIAFTSLIFSGADTGWTFYTPYSIDTDNGTVWLVAGAFVMGFSSILTGLNFIATVHKLRAPGMSFFRMPLFVWGLYSTAIIQVLATPVLGITLLLLVGERLLGIGIFDPTLGGDPVLFQHFFWFYSHPRCLHYDSASDGDRE